MQAIKQFWLMGILLGCGCLQMVRAQDPNFSQFYAAPFSINPALTGNFYGSMNAIFNFRNQWSGPIDPYRAMGASIQYKLLEKKLPQKNVLATSAMVLRDQTMGGAFNSTYASFNLAYHIGLDAEGLQKIGFGLGGIYAHRRIDYNLLNFPQQFTSGGFDTNLPTGETGFANIKPFVSMSTGIMYSFTSEDHGTNFDIGVAAFHLNKPQQTAYEDQNQYIQPRYTVYGTYSSFLSDRASMSLNGIYQNQQATEFWQFGGVLGMLLDNSNEPPVFNLGVWYRNQDAVIPYIGFSTKLFESVAQVGISYDVTVSQFKNARIKPQTLELSLILRSSRPDGSVPCPWK